jgi:hypothetical protein
MRAFHQRWPEPLVATVVALLTLAVPSGAEAEGAAAPAPETGHHLRSGTVSATLMQGSAR